MEHVAPTPADIKSDTKTKSAVPAVPKELAIVNHVNYSAVKVTIVGCGGAGINIARPLTAAKGVDKVVFFDTSMTNTRSGEHCFNLGDGSGSGSHRAENAREIERKIPLLSNEEIGVNDVVVILSSLSGGSGSVLNPLLARDYIKRGARVICVLIADTSYSVAANNTLNSLKTFTAIAKNNNIYLPAIVVSNDHAKTRRAVDETLIYSLSDLIDILTRDVYEVDRNDRLNWINPTKVTNSPPGLKLMYLTSNHNAPDTSIVLGANSDEMVDSLLILQGSPDEAVSEGERLPYARLKKLGFYSEPHKRIVGRVSSDISEIEKIIDSVEQMIHAEKSHRQQGIDRLSTNHGDDLVL